MKKLSLLFILFFVFIISCGKTETSSTQTETSSQTAAPVEKNRVYVNADWVKSVIDGNQSQSSNYVILEASWGDPSADYKKAHIPGALHINTDLICKKINLENLVNNDEIILNETIESSLIDVLKEIKNTNTLDVKLSEDDKLLMINKLIRDNLSGFAYKRSYAPVKEALYRFFREYLCTKEIKNEMVYLQSIILNNYDIIANLIAKSTELYKPVKEQELAKKAANLANWDFNWEVQENRSYNPNMYEKFESSICLYSPCYLKKDRSKAEIKFIEYLENNASKIKWWWKNGDEHMRDNFGIQKPDFSSFQPDFLILYKNNSLGIYDTKDAGFQEEDTKIKAEALQKYIKEESNEHKKIIGGIIIIDNNGRIRINNHALYNAFKTNPEDWEYFELK